MTELVDSKIAEIIEDVLLFPLERVIYGQADVAKEYWIRYNGENPGIEMLPWISFYRTYRFHESFRKTESLPIIDFDGNAKNMDFIPIMLSYVMEMMTSSVADANKLIKRWMLFAGKKGCISFTEESGINYEWRIIAEDPEDNSDLQGEGDYERIVRTTLNFQVETILLDRKEDIASPILQILAKIHLYYDNINEARTAVEVTLEDE